MNSLDKWHPRSWRAFPIRQEPRYIHIDELERVESELKGYPPLVFTREVDLLKEKLAKVNDGKLFVLQGGDCAESFARFSDQRIENFYKLILQMSVILGFCSGMEILKIGRIAGQFAKPRSEEFEEIDGVKIPNFRGDMINSSDPTLESRIHQPQRMLQAYHQSASTLNLLRAFCNGGMADLHLIQKYNLDFVTNHPMGSKYQKLAQEIFQTLTFIESCGVEANQMSNFSEFFTSHEALLLHYEECLCRTDRLNNRFYDCSAHFLWIGERTFDSKAHFEFMRGISNPKGIKISSRVTPSDLLQRLDWLNPDNQKGEIVLIIRMGEDHIIHSLPKLFEAIKRDGREVVVLNDPMHGNTIKQNGIKTRYFSSIVNELERFFDICMDYGMRPGGIHLEMTAEEVTECIGGVIVEESLNQNYQTTCDPRLNASQSLELAFGLGEKMRKSF